ncbi:phosphate ABC transporter substrate-binding protein PstS [Edaphobacter aggregans]|uniref:phosphate ABC transporter substrate-binding protein PstS n=1 Tax=Edaphobacter aggregans TaxID=570835 RepID=UPI00054F72FE|nr:phosphate ABC transporter substrate-binding protein PstS [Edaphobacter aggregans]
MKRNVIAAGVLALATLGASAQNINGAGATFPYPIYSKWFTEYSQQHPNVKINYQSIGSGGGIRQVSEGTVDFGATDGPMSDEQIAQAKIKTQHIPTVLGAVVPVYNLPGVNKDLNFSGDVIADIYLGKISKWNDGRIAKDNPGVSLPDKPILPVYRSDGSGTTYIFTDYLSKVSPDWVSKVGKGTSVKWSTGIGQKGNEGVAGMVRQSPYSFGYVELIYALQNKMPFGSVKNASGKFVKATTDGVTAAAAAAAKTMPADYRVSITNAPGPNSYPISSFTWLLIPLHSTDAAKSDALKGFMNWMLDHGESEASSLSYAPLPKQVQDMVRKTITQIK